MPPWDRNLILMYGTPPLHPEPAACPLCRCNPCVCAKTIPNPLTPNPMVPDLVFNTTPLVFYICHKCQRHIMGSVEGPGKGPKCPWCTREKRKVLAWAIRAGMVAGQGRYYSSHGWWVEERVHATRWRPEDRDEAIKCRNGLSMAARLVALTPGTGGSP